MPKYIEERDWIRPIPGAFGIDIPKGGRHNGLDVQYLTKTGYYADRLYIFIDIEYGYASYLWVYPGTAIELVGDWIARRVPWHRSWDFSGEFDLVDFRTLESEMGNPFPRNLKLVLSKTGDVFDGHSRISHFDGHAHVHEEDDSVLNVGFYKVRGIRHTSVTFDVLGAMASL